MFKLLFVEDEKTSVDPVILHLQRGSVQYDCTISDFASAQTNLREIQPDIIVLDILDGGGTGDPQPAGNSVLDFVWKLRFCPIVLYSAHLDRLAEGDWSNHPFVKTVQKGSGSENQLEDALNLFHPHVTALRESEVFVRNVFASALRDVAPFAFAEFQDEAQRKDVIRRTGRRRLAAMMDEAHSGDKLASWEAYVYPTVAKNVSLGDILMLTMGAATNVSDFRVVLRPSCDMVKTETRVPKVEKVLVAKCISVKDGLADIQKISQLKMEKLLGELPSLVLSQGYYQRLVPFPELKGKIPSMMADLKRLELLPLDDIISEQNAKYSRIASLDSPFRELVSWAYMQTACRLGLPERDFDTWSKEIVAADGA